MTTPSTLKKSLSRPEAIAVLWHKGILHYKLHSGQKALYDSFINSNTNHKSLVWSCSRRLGKSFTLCLIAIEICIKKPNAIVKYVAPQQKQVKTIIMPLFREILRDCPKELRPQYKTQDNCYRFPNGSEIQLAGADNQNAENLRGGASNLCVVDEAGFIDDLEYVVQSILMPTTLTTNGKIILASTPPKTMDHAFRGYIETASKRGSFVKKTIYDNPMLTPDVIKSYMEESGGENSTSWRREYLCELIVDENFVVIPEFTRMKERIVREWEVPPWFDRYVAMDIGVTDFTVVLFAYYDFKSAKLIIEDEFVLNSQKWNTEILAKGIKDTEAKYYTNKLTGEVKAPYKRVSDTNLTVLNDLYQLHRLQFNKTAKDDADAALSNMRVMIGQGRIVINPRCVTLINHLEFAIWDKNKTKIIRSSDHGHYDGVDALKYLVRNVDWNKNPYPAHYDLNLRQGSDFHRVGQSSPYNAIKKIFNLK